ncbi:MAG: rRNA maturation RNase YbeY [Treponema sp.]|nr:rRNA maturation RNase YbeY [Treponema sp.]MCI6545963.1 rRNA maturation RNase YbeY [Spirochaetia bacterium]MEE1268727.1 rRNA maturation RNase YbeY [Treponema sp.]
MANRVFVSVQEKMDEPVWLCKVEPFVQKALKRIGYDGEELSLLFCDDAFIQELNKNYRQIDSATDVLSFENGDEYEDEEGTWFCAGDIIISVETLPKNAAYFEVDENSELKRLLVHGLLHLNGMDHGDEHIEKGVAPEGEMLVLQEQILEELKDEILISK